MVKASSQRRTQSGATPSRDEGEGISKHQPQSQGVRRNCPWTEAEHLLFLLGLEEHGRGAWRAIASDFVGTRTATQVASHAQKYFLREGLPPSKREKKRPSIHDLRCSRNASQEDRHQLRTSLQQLNRESMESNDSRVADAQQAGAKASTGTLAGRAVRPKAETGSSGDTSVAAGGRPAPSAAHWSDAAYSFGADGSSGRPGSFAPTSLADRPRARSLPDWQLAGRSAPLTATQDAFSGQAFLPETSDPAVGILDPLYDEVLNCELSTEPGAYPRNPGGRASDMSLEHSFDQTHLGRGNSLSDTRQLFPLSEGQAAPPEDSLMLGSTPGRAVGDRSALWRQPFYTAYGSATGMYDSLFRPEQPVAAAPPQPAMQRASLPSMAPQLQPGGYGQYESPQERRMYGSLDLAHCSQPPPLTHSLPQGPLQRAPSSHALPDVSGGTPHLQNLGPLLSSQSAPPGNALPMGHYSSALYRPTQLSLNSGAVPATEPAFPSTGPSCMPSGDSVDDLRILAQRADEMGIGTSDLEPQNMDEILGSMSLGMDMDL
eukprot:jgi/Ulvmu1/2972/UM015_0012.1